MDERLPACDAPRHWLARMLGRPPVSVVGLAIAYALSPLLHWTILRPARLPFTQQLSSPAAAARPTRWSKMGE